MKFEPPKERMDPRSTKGTVLTVQVLQRIDDQGKDMAEFEITDWLRLPSIPKAYRSSTSCPMS